MAEAILRQRFGDVYEVHSAGTEATEVNSYALKVLEEIGIDTSILRSKSIDEYVGDEFNEVVTVCDNAKENCPFFPGARNYLHKGFRDPPVMAEEDGIKSLDAFRIIRDEIRSWIEVEFGI